MTSEAIAFLSEFAFVFIIFFGFLFYTMARGRQSIINLILGLYFALLISYTFPYYDALIGESSAQTASVVRVCLFVAFTIFSTIIFTRLSYSGTREGFFAGFPRKVAYALAATVLVLNFSFNTLPIAEFIDPGPIQGFFDSAQAFFWWLFVPVGVLFFL